MPGTVLFDMDGVLLETEGLKARAHSDTLSSFGGALPPEAYARWMGSSQREAQAGFMEAAGIDVPHEQYLARFSESYRALLLEGVETTPGARELLAELRGHRYRLALVTSSLRWMVDHVLGATGLRPFFDAVVCAEDVVREKPAPDAYLRALELLGGEPSAAVVVEDTQVGVAAGAAAGCTVIAVRHRFNGRHDFGRAAHVLPSLLPTDRVSGIVRSALPL